MKEVIDFLKKNPVGGFATINNNKPKIRPFQFMLEKDGKIYFATSNKKDVYKEMQNNPNVSFTSYAPDTRYIRIEGKVKFSDDMNLKGKVIESSEILKKIYKTGSNPVFEIFCIDSGKITIDDLLGNPAKKYNI